MVRVSKPQSSSKQQRMLLGLLVVLLFGMVYFLYARPRSSDAAELRKTLEQTEAQTKASLDKLALYSDGSEELSTATARIETADRLLPQLDPGDLEAEQYLRLNLPNKLLNAMQTSGLTNVAIADFGMHVPAGMPQGLIAMTFEFRARGSVLQLEQALKTLNNAGITTTLSSAGLSAPSASEGGSGEASTSACFVVTLSETSCFAQNVQLLVWYRAPEPKPKPGAETTSTTVPGAPSPSDSSTTTP